MNILHLVKKCYTRTVGWIVSTTWIVRVLQFYELLIIKSEQHLWCDDYLLFLLEVFDLMQSLIKT